MRIGALRLRIDRDSCAVGVERCTQGLCLGFCIAQCDGVHNVLKCIWHTPWALSLLLRTVHGGTGKAGSEA
jgi:hypothetical protein